MRRVIFALIVFCLVLLPLKSEIALNIGGVYSGAFSINNISYPTTWSDNSGIVSFSERNDSEFKGSGGAGFNAGLSFFFNYKMGFGISVATLKTNYKISNVFNWHFQWWNGTASDIEPKVWESEGDVNVIPVNVDIIFRVVSQEKIKLNLFLGPTVFFASPQLSGNGGYADGPIEYQGTYYIDWYDLPLEFKNSKTLFGGNGGIEFEYFFTESMAFYLNASYYFGGNIDDNWKVKLGKYTGEFGNIVGTISDENSLPGYKMKINVSTFAIGAGVKVYL